MSVPSYRLRSHNPNQFNSSEWRIITAIQELSTEQGYITIADIHQVTGLSKSAIHLFVRDRLFDEGLLTRQSQRYYPTAQLLALQPPTTTTETPSSNKSTGKEERLLLAAATVAGSRGSIKGVTCRNVPTGDLGPISNQNVGRILSALANKGFLRAFGRRSHTGVHYRVTDLGWDEIERLRAADVAENGPADP